MLFGKKWLQRRQREISISYLAFLREAHERYFRLHGVAWVPETNASIARPLDETLLIQSYDAPLSTMEIRLEGDYHPLFSQTERLPDQCPFATEEQC